MRSFANTLAALNQSLKHTFEKIREVLPQPARERDLPLVKEHQSEVGLIWDDFWELIDNYPREWAANSNLAARVCFNVSHLLGRMALFEEAQEVLACLHKIPGELSQEAQALGHFSLALIALAQHDLDGALHHQRKLMGLGETDILLRIRAEGAFYLSYGLFCENREKEAEELYFDLVEHRERILANPLRRRSERPLTQPHLNGTGKPRPDKPSNPGELKSEGEPGEENFNFPLVLTADPEKLLSLRLPRDFPEVGSADNSLVIVARLLTVFTVFYGSSPGEKKKRALVFLKEFDKWGGTWEVSLRKAEATVALISFFCENLEPQAAKELFLETFQGSEVPETHLKQMEVYRVKALINLLAGFGLTGEVQATEAIYQEIQKSPLKDDVLTAKSTLNMITTFAAKGELLKALEIFEAVPDWGTASEARGMRGKGALILIFYFGHQGDLEQAHKIYQKHIVSSHRSSGSRLILDRASRVFVSLYENLGELAGAEEFYLRMEHGKGDPEQDLEWIKATQSLINLYGRLNKPQEAFNLYRGLGPFNHAFLEGERAGIAVNLILLLGRAGIPKRARDVYNFMPDWGINEELDLLRAKGAVNLIAVLDASLEPRKAKSVYLGIPEDTLELMLEKAKACVTLVGLFGKNGEPDKSLELYLDFPDGETPAFQDLKESAAMNLIVAYAMADDWRNALKSASKAIQEGLSENKRGELIKRLNFIMSKTTEFAKKDLLNFRKLMDSLKTPPH
ncbi:MAG: hypothetical protein LBF22_09690 [Deltaproteobacteria bacterium]|jgi:tetratricopeptide (TPR) repeat protein|nr:hypothetical protein [Deltaproteobacteria bacterium]